MVSVVMTQNSMKSIIKGDETFDLLYERYVDFGLLLSTGTKADRTLMLKKVKY